MKLKGLGISFALYLCGFGGLKGLEASELPKDLGDLKRDITQMVSAYGESVSFSLREPGGKELFNLRGDQLFSPASVAKMVSSACTLETLGPDFQFETAWGYRGEIKGEKLEGDLVVRGSGDFSYVIEDLKMAAEQIRYVFGIKEITGKLVYDVSYLGRPQMNIFEGFEGDKGRAFTSVATAHPINHNAYSIWIYPQSPKPLVSVIPHQAVDLDMTNRLSLVNGRLNGSRTSLDYRPDDGKLILSGQIGRSDNVRAYYRSLRDPYASFTRLFKFNLELLGVKWGGETSFSPTPANFEALWTHRSTNMGRLLVDVNKLSTNFGAELSLLAAAAQAFGLPTSLEKSQKLLNRCISSWGLSDKDFRLENASGLTRDSRIKTSALTQFLSKISSAPYAPEFQSSLAILGLDGTTRSRLPHYAYRARLKTGSLNNVRTIAGYVDHPQRGKLAMALFLNCGSCDLGRWIRVEDEVISRILR